MRGVGKLVPVVRQFPPDPGVQRNEQSQQQDSRGESRSACSKP